MILKATFTVYTDHELKNEKHLKDLAKALDHDMRDNLIFGPDCLPDVEGDYNRIKVETHVVAEAQHIGGFDDYCVLDSNYHERGEWDTWITAESDDEPDSTDSPNPETSSVVDAEAETGQILLFKSVRRKPSKTEMMAELIEFCNRG